MSTLYLECTSGISGDMFVAALLDLGADRASLDKALKSLPVSGFEIKISDVTKSGIKACDFDVILDKEHENHDHDMGIFTVTIMITGIPMTVNIITIIMSTVLLRGSSI